MTTDLLKKLTLSIGTSCSVLAYENCESFVDQWQTVEYNNYTRMNRDIVHSLLR